jgi:tetratricopeptide (TPR) repeat protein
MHNRARLGMLTETLALLEPLPPGPEHVAVLTEISGEHHQLKQYDTGLEVADRALTLAAELGLGRPARTLGYRATSRSYLGDAEAIDDFREALAIALAAGQVRHASTIYHNWGIHLVRYEGPAQALEISSEGIALCRARGLTARVYFMLANHVNYLMRVGELDEALATAAALKESGRREGDSYRLAQALDKERVVLLRRGQMKELAELLDEFEDGLDDPARREEMGVRLNGAGQIRALMGQREAAVALFTRLADESLPALLDSIQLAITLGEVELAARLGPDSSAVAEARGELETAAAGYGKSADSARSLGDDLQLATMLVPLARVLTRLGRTEEAIEALNEARPILVKLQAAPLLAETDALLEQLTALSA